MVDVEGPADILGAMLAAIDEGVVDLQFGDVAHRPRHGDAARLGHGLDALGEIDAVAEQVVIVLVDHDLAQMHADAEQQLLLLGQQVVETRHALLDVDRRRDRGQRRAEFGQHASPVPWTIEPPASSTAGRQTSLFTARRFLKVSSSSPSVRRTKPARSA